jgi:Tubulin-tyrosine ligase family
LESVLLSALNVASQVNEAAATALAKAWNGCGPLDSIGAGLPYACIYDVSRSELMLVNGPTLSRLGQVPIGPEGSISNWIRQEGLAARSALGHPFALAICRAGAAYAGARTGSPATDPRLVWCNDPATALSQSSRPLKPGEGGGQPGSANRQFGIGDWLRVRLEVGDPPDQEHHEGESSGFRLVTLTCPDGPGVASLVFERDGSWFINGLPEVGGARLSTGSGGGILRHRSAPDRGIQGSRRDPLRVDQRLPKVVILAPPGDGEATWKATRIARALAATSLLDAVALGPEWVQWTVDGVVAHWPPDRFGNGWRSIRPDVLACLGVWALTPVSRRFTLESSDGPVQMPETFDSWAFRTLLRAASDGICVNYERVLFEMGSKKLFEERCREAEVNHSLSVLRPRTWLIAPGGEEHGGEQLPADARPPFIIKPDLGAQGYGITFASSVDDVPEVRCDSVVQEVVEDPVTLDGHKIDARSYVVVRTGSRSPFTMLPLIVIRRTIAPYQRGNPDAEISNLSYARRKGSTLQAIPLDEVEPPAMRAEIRRSIEATLGDLFVMMSQFATEPGMVGLWAVDLALKQDRGGMEALVLEVNTAPEIYRGHVALDAATDAMLADRVAPLLSQYLSGAG